MTIMVIIVIRGSKVIRVIIVIFRLISSLNLRLLGFIGVQDLLAL